MAFEFDHLFIWTTPDAPEAQRLIDFGLSEGTPNSHPGQGTANRRFFFANAMLEFLWVAERGDAQNEQTSRTKLWDRWAGQRSGASAFGIALRPTNHARSGLPFEGWKYCPSYIPDQLFILVGENCDQLHEPFLFYLPFGDRPDAPGTRKHQPITHRAGVREITSLRLVSPALSTPSPVVQAVNRVAGIEIECGDQKEVLVIEFDEGRTGGRCDFQPALPLIFRW